MLEKFLLSETALKGRESRFCLCTLLTLAILAVSGLTASVITVRIVATILGRLSNVFHPF